MEDLNQREFCPRCGADLDEQGICHMCGYRHDDPFKGHPMKWFQFIIFVQLFANIISNVFTGVSLFNGSIFGTGAYHIYTTLPFLAVFNKFMAVLYFALSFYIVYVWRLLKALKKEAPYYLRISRILSLVLGVLVNVGMLVISELPVFYLLMDVGMLSSIAIMLYMIHCEKKYFAKRSDVFIY